MQRWLGSDTFDRRLIEGQCVLEESDGHRVVAHMKVNQSHVIRYDRIVVLAVLPARKCEITISWSGNAIS